MRVCAGLLAVALLAAQDAGIDRGFEHFYNLEFPKAIDVFRVLVEKRPGEARVHNHLAQAILYREMLKAGALESELVTGGNSFLRREKMNPTPEDEQRFHECITRSMRLSQQRLDKDPDDRRGLYDMGVAHGLRSNWNFLVRKAWMDSLREATTGRKLHNRLTELDPSLIDARLMQGVHDYVVGSVPWHMKFLGFLAGYRGDKEKGIQTLQLVAERGRDNKADAEILLCVVYRRERRAADAVPLLQDLIKKFPRNYLLRLEMSQMLADLGKRQESLEVLAEVERLKRGGASGFDRLSFEKISYFRGVLHFWYDNLDAAIANLERVTAKAEEMDPNTGVMAWMRLGQSYDLKGQREKARQAYQAAMDFAPESEVARESRGYLRTPYRRKKG